jgi:YD repeat-containing protein
MQDENGNDWQKTSDALGRLTNVAEPNGASQTPSLITSYGYDPLGNLLSVTQNGASGNTARMRTFTYDSLSRLLQATNPETGTVCYGIWSGANCVNGYDNNGNLLSKTDARGITTTYQYDNLSRLLSKTYSDGATPSSCYQYDVSSSNNSIGRLSVECVRPGKSILFADFGR